MQKRAVPARSFATQQAASAINEKPFVGSERARPTPQNPDTRLRTRAEINPRFSSVADRDMQPVGLTFGLHAAIVTASFHIKKAGFLGP
eukprot:14897539-Heterocapsa_arctica.AAC.1